MLARASLFAIYGYQRFLSPRKGFACAYRVQNGGTGCSGYAKHAIRDHRLLRAIPLIRARFSACKAAALALSEQRGDDETDKKQRKKARKSGARSSCIYDGCMFASCAGGGTTAASDSGDAAASGSGSTCDDMSCGDASCGDCSPSCDACSCGS